jgi:hypothetical protein
MLLRCRFAFGSVMQTRVPAVAVLANGGMISKKEILFAVRHAIPVIVIEGSGRLADQVRTCADPHYITTSTYDGKLQIARAIHRRDETPPEEWDPAILVSLP